MNGDGPGPTCASRLGHQWIDGGTNSLTRMGSPTPLGIIASMVFGALPSDPMMAKYNAEHVYSKAPEAATKRRIDLQIIGGDYSRGHEVSMDNEAYLKRLIDIVSQGMLSAGPSPEIQFFIIKGGGEGFLPAYLAGENAGQFVSTSVSTSGVTSTQSIFDQNDLLAVFDKVGTLVNASRLERPLYLPPSKGFVGWSKKTAERVYASWANKKVFIYANTSFEIPYLGLGVRDGMRGNVATVDIHKQESTNGCIFIVDRNTPAIDDSNLGAFEPKLIRDVLANLGLSPSNVGTKHIPLGIMRVIDVLGI